jgi:hypothetical protein
MMQLLAAARWRGSATLLAIGTDFLFGRCRGADAARARHDPSQGAGKQFAGAARPAIDHLDLDVAAGRSAC